MQKTTEPILKQIRARAASGMTKSEIARSLKKTQQSVSWLMKRYDIKVSRPRNFPGEGQFSLAVRRPRAGNPMTRLREARLESGLTVKQVAAACGLGAMQVQLAETGKILPYPKMRKTLSKLFGIPSDVLFRDYDNAIETIRADPGIRSELPNWKPRVLATEHSKRYYPGDENEPDPNGPDPALTGRRAVDE